MRFNSKSVALVLGLLTGIAVSDSSAGASLGLRKRAVIDASPTDTFIYDRNGVNFTFTFTANANGDFWFSMAAPSRFGWVAVGSGDQMAGSMMMVAYGDGTPSGRFGSGHVEPSYSKEIDLTMVTPPHGPANVIQDGMLYVSGACRNCTHLAAEKIDLTNKMQSFVFALGEVGRFPATKSRSGPLRRHAYYGSFTMDLTKATDEGGDDTIPLHDEIENSQLTSFTTDTDIADLGHAFIMLLAFLVVFPVGVLCLRILGSVKIHMIMQSVGLGLAIIGGVSGIYLSTIYNRTLRFDTAHQIIGLLVVLGLIGQWVGGFLHHRFFVLTQRAWQNGLPIKGHKMVTGPILLLAGFVNGALGFDLAVAYRWNYVYVPLALTALAVFAAIMSFRRFMNRRHTRSSRPKTSHSNHPWRSNWFGQRSISPGSRFLPTRKSQLALARIPSADPSGAA